MVNHSKTLIFGGMQKLTLLDFPAVPACTLFTVGCNFACRYCHNPALIPFESNETGLDNDRGEETTGSKRGGAQRLPEEKIFEFLKKRQGLLEGVCISGGEPLAQQGIAEFIREVKKLGYLVKIDTNGSYHDRLIELIENEGIDYVAMDIKNAPAKYAETIGKTGFNTKSVIKSIEYLLRGKVPYEFRTTVVRELHNEKNLVEIARLIRGAPKYYLQKFSNPENALSPGLSAHEPAELEKIYKAVKEILPCAELR